MKRILTRFKALFSRLAPMGVLAVLLVVLIVPTYAYSGSYGNLSSNMLNYEVLALAEYKLTDERYEVINDTVYRFNYRSDLSYGQWELYPYYTTSAWHAKSVSYIPFKNLFPYVRVGETLNLAYFTMSSGGSSGGIYIAIFDGSTDNGYPVEYGLGMQDSVVVTEQMLAQGRCVVRISHTKAISNNVYFRGLGVYTGTAIRPSNQNSGSSAVKEYAMAIYTTWNETKTLYDELAQQAYNEAYNAGYGNGKADGYTEGYNKGVADTQDSNNTFGAFFNSAFQAPLNFLQGLFGWELFGVNLWALLKALFTILIAFTLITIILKAVF